MCRRCRLPRLCGGSLNTFEPIPLGKHYFLDADERQWIVYRERAGEGGKPLKDKRAGKVRREVIGYFPTLTAALHTVFGRRLRCTRWQDWDEVLWEAAEMERKLLHRGGVSDVQFLSSKGEDD